MSTLSQLYVFSHPLSLSQQLRRVAQFFGPELAPLFASADLMVVNGDRESEVILPLQIEQVRELQLAVLQAPLQYPVRVFMILDVQTASQPALNALLKLLEEPPAHVQFVLTTHQLQMVLPTIQSRCQIIHSFSEDAEYPDKTASPLPTLPTSLIGTITNHPAQYLQLTAVFQISEAYKEKPQAIELITSLIQQIHFQQTTHPRPFWTTFLQSALQSLQLLDQNVNTRLVIEELLFALLKTP